MPDDNGNGVLMKLFLSLASVFIAGSIVLYGVVSAQGSDIASASKRMERYTDRMDRMETRYLENHRAIRDDVSEIRKMLMDMKKKRD